MATPSPKYDSFRDSALHFLCLSGWGNESAGDTDGYGVYFTRITLGWDDIRPSNGEFNSLIEQWPDYVDSNEAGIPFRTQLIGHYIVSEDSNGFVHVRELGSEAAVKARFDAFAEHYANWTGEVSE